MARYNSFTSAQKVSHGIELSGFTAVVTGASSGIGVETARVLALRGAHVVMACRSMTKAARVRQALIDAGASAERLEPRQLELSDLESVVRFVDAMQADFTRLDILINNAGVMNPERRETAQGHEAHFGVNHLGHFVLTRRLLPLLRKAPAPRVVSVASEAMNMASTDPHFSDLQWKVRPYEGWVSYGDSKLMNLLFTREFAEREGMVAHSVHPGVIPTGLVGDRPDARTLLLALRVLPQFRSVSQGAASTVYTAVHPDTAQSLPGYYAWCRPHAQPPLAHRGDVRKRLWQLSEHHAAGYLD